MVWHRFTDNSSQYWVSIIPQILGRKLVNRLHIYLLNCYLPPLIFLLQYTAMDFLFIILQILSIFGDMSTVYFYRELSPTSHCMHTIFWNISLKMTKIWQIKATHRTLSSVPSFHHLVNWYYWHFTKSCIDIVQKSTLGGFSKIIYYNKGPLLLYS